MAITTVLFDLDGTLLPMDLDEFIKTYFGSLAKKLSAHGYEPNKLVESVWKGTVAMIKNDGKKTNEEVFWEVFTQIYGEQAKGDLPHFDAFYRDHFDEIQSVCGYRKEAAETVALVKELGFRVALATNPIFPAIATQKRMAWAGLSPDDFAFYTTYENSRYCKPNLHYYEEVLARLGVSGEECLMVGNDVGEDMVARKLGMQVFLLTDCIINRKEEDISVYPHGGFADLKAYIKGLANE